MYVLQVKIWCTKQEACALNIDMKANICSVKYNPGSSIYVAVSLPQSLFLDSCFIQLEKFFMLQDLEAVVIFSSLELIIDTSFQKHMSITIF